MAPAFQLVLMHAGVVALIALYFYAWHPAWSWMYWVDPKRLGGVFVLPLMVGHAMLVFGGWYGSALLIRRNVAGALAYVAGALGLVLVILLAAGFSRLTTAADYEGFGEHAGVSAFSVQLGWACIVSLLVLFASAIYISVELSRDGRRVRAR